MRPAAFPPAPPGHVTARIAGLHMLLSESLIRLRAMQAVLEDVADGIVRLHADHIIVTRFVSDSLGSELADMERLLGRLHTLIAEARR